ncbi:helix-turn-helix domain-containing protein [Paenibacillus macquariensis]|uniref:DNA binding domain-containing protein, excisionase family n=1 Tax=Paenibacillus macquariensis TaxID=948756 RepID=A0ABY1KES5_9BACL|nr:helix-turn-helix domain-containing protein [Paenibacillus macquariensis]OAB27855.1 hypothetical protein PMSM_24485 [Paenibacillus macquariensis subsp. macquariensis]SIR72441.1 DNA binding domain-containing protein, excisionase family [Paenibacillus macquariensis]
MNVKEAAEALGVHTQTVYNMLNSGRLQAEKEQGGKWDISKDFILEIVKKTQEKQDQGRAMMYATDLLDAKLYEKEQETQADLNSVCKAFVLEFEGDQEGSKLAKIIVEMEKQIQELSGIKNAIKIAMLLNIDAIGDSVSTNEEV